jgi:hypothetical protein
MSDWVGRSVPCQFIWHGCFRVTHMDVGNGGHVGNIARPAYRDAFTAVLTALPDVRPSLSTNTALFERNHST